MLLDSVAQNHPKLPIIMAHAGGGAGVREAIGVIQNNFNCFGEVSPYGITQRNLRMFSEYAGAERIILGPDSNRPEDIRRNIEMIESWGLSEGG